MINVVPPEAAASALRETASSLLLSK